MTTDLQTIARQAIEKEEENSLFSDWIRTHDSTMIDEIVHDINRTVSAEIDCTRCGNCCRSLMINVSEADTQRLALHLKLSESTVNSLYIEKSSEGSTAIMNAIPCHFLEENKCSVYESRPHECREFPGLHNSGISRRLFALFMHYGRCPIVFNVMEKLKTELNFRPVDRR